MGYRRGSSPSAANANGELVNMLPGRIPNSEAKEIMGIPDCYRMTNDQIGEAVPPPMAYIIAREAMRQIKENYEDKKNETIDCPPTRSI